MTKRDDAEFDGFMREVRETIEQERNSGTVARSYLVGLLQDCLDRLATK